MEEVKGKWCLNYEFLEGLKLSVGIKFVIEEELEQYKAEHQNNRTILGEIRCEYYDTYEEVCKILSDLSTKMLKREES